MTKGEIMILLGRKTKDAIVTAELDSCKHNDAWNHYYYGVAAKAVGKTLNNISACLRGKSKTSGGYIWKYATLK